MPITGSFDASQHAPKQIGESHPVGKFPFKIGSTEIVPTKDNTGGMFVVHFDTPSGSIVMRYNLWNQSAKAMEIAHGQLSALCHATGIFKLDWQNDGAALRGAQGMIEVVDQLEDGKPNGYTKVLKVLDKNGNEPGKAPAAAPAPSSGQAWATKPQTEPSPAQNGGWGPSPQTQQPNPPAPPNPPNAWSGGTQQAPPTSNPPWRT